MCISIFARENFLLLCVAAIHRTIHTIFICTDRPLQIGIASSVPCKRGSSLSSWPQRLTDNLKYFRVAEKFQVFEKCRKKIILRQMLKYKEIQLYVLYCVYGISTMEMKINELKRYVYIYTYSVFFSFARYIHAANVQTCVRSFVIRCEMIFALENVNNT